MKILAIDTSTEACSAALMVGQEVISEFQLAPREHTQLILPMVERLLAQADLKLNQLDALSFARGPGAFTGIRIAAGVIQGLSYVDDIPVLPVSTLAAIAQGVCDQHDQQGVLAAIDARMGEIYWGIYKKGASGVELVADEIVTTIDQLVLPAGLEISAFAGAGTGWGEYTESLQQKCGISGALIWGDFLPAASDIVTLAAVDFAAGKAISAHQAQPVYLRDDVAKKKQQQTTNSTISP